jgi:lipopolysaccharide/colanic/teichoic acid biosynthesis glycosyltransferase
VEREFSVEHMVAAHLSFYAQVLNGTHAHNHVDARSDWYVRFGKRTFDVTVAGSALLLFLPLLAAISVIVRMTLGRPVFFRQRRPGLNGDPFTLVKFRSLAERHDHQGRPLPDADRLTRVGRVLRGTSLDELPELWNVLSGNMSLVGPRPLLMEYLPRYSPRHARRHAVKPGITGLAQVNGRNELPWEERFELDVFYAERISLWLDLRILARTVWLVIAGRGISEPGHATAQEFRGAEGQ